MEVLGAFKGAIQSPATGTPAPVDQPRKFWREAPLTGTDAGALT
jgi:hypothetical protein